jgi:hypothetical protein
MAEFRLGGYVMPNARDDDVEYVMIPKNAALTYTLASTN